MDYIFGSDEGAEDVGSKCSQKISYYVNDDDDGGGEFYLQSLSQADDQRQCHRQNRKEKFIIYARESA